MEPDLILELEPVVRRIVRWRLGNGISLQDREDVAGDILLELLARFDAVRQGEGGPIGDVAAYTAVVSHHGCDGYLRRRSPQRYRLGTRIRYLLEHSPGYAIWRKGEQWVCGAANRRGEAPRTDLHPGWVSQVSVSQVSLPARVNETRAVTSIFAYAGAPLRLPDLIDATATLLNVRDHVASLSDMDVAGADWDRDLTIDRRRTLGRLWGEIAQLPLAQRLALLLNLREDDGSGALASLPATGVASMREIAAVIETPAGKLAEMWKDLPLNDLAIGAMLGITRQQVINLRKSARERLARRMAGNIGPKPDSTK